MGMSCGMIQTHCIMQTVTDDSYGTCFPKAEELLQESMYQEALEEIGTKRTMERYRSMMDFLLCELKPSYRRECFRFYREKGPRLIQIESAKEIEKLDNYLTGVLLVALEYKKQGVKTSWNSFRNTIANMAA